MFRPKFTSVFFFALCLLFAAPHALAQQASNNPPAQASSAQDGQSMRALLEEVRQLRLVLQRNSVNAYRAQTLMERLARQQRRVDDLTAELDQIKAQLQQAQELNREEDELKDLEATINETADPQARAQLLQAYASLKRSLARQREYARQEAERCRERQQQLEMSLSAEQGRLAEIQEQLNAVDREMDKQIAEMRKGRP